MQPLFDHPRTRIHVSHAETLRKILDVCESFAPPAHMLAAIEKLAREALR